jgi:hypothetical protein
LLFLVTWPLANRHYFTLCQCLPQKSCNKHVFNDYLKKKKKEKKKEKKETQAQSNPRERLVSTGAAEKQGAHKN